jgi:hypothetical protein
MNFRIYGRIRELESKKGLSNLVVQAKDEDILTDDMLGEITTGADGSYNISCSEEASRDLFADKPDVYIIVKSAEGKLLKTTKDDIRFDVDKEIEIDLDIPHITLAGAGVVEREPAEWMKELDQEQLKKFKTWIWQKGYDENDEMVINLKKDLVDKSSVLELMKDYINDLKGTPDNDAVPFIKLKKLFELGATPEKMEGHFYGLTLGLRTGGLKGNIARFANVLGFLWGYTLADECPWVGKSFSLLDEADLETMTSKSFKPEAKAYLGINHFNRINSKPLNIISFQVLNWWMGLEDVSQSEKAIYGNEKDGGNFIAYKAHSVYHGTDREVILLNYRWKNLDNLPPFRWLIDELVQVADGVYLGQLLFATKRLQHTYDPERPDSDYKYQHFGYFLLFDDTWNPEARRLFPHFEMPVIAPGLRRSNIAESYNLPKFSSFTFEEQVSPNCNDAIMAKINGDLKDKPTIMHLLKEYSDELQNNFDNDSPYFLRMQELFNRGIGIKTVKGFFRGALVSWHSEGLLKLLDINTLNLAWMKAGRFFSPWTGKSFEEIDTARLKEITDGHERGEVPTFWGSNTQALRTPKEKFMGKLMKLAKIWSEAAPPDEAREFGYDLKCFFFIGKQAKSVNEHNKGKDIFQFNYRWPKLKTIPPDCYCVDELVQIADGLYLGQLMYATELFKPYDPLKDPSEYKYGLFGYFLLMDEEWHQVRLNIGYDLENV